MPDHDYALVGPAHDELCTTIATRVARVLERRAIEHDDPEERALALARSASRRGASMHTPESAESADPEHDRDSAWKIKARVDGYDLDATTVVRAEDRERLEHLCRYLLRPPLADRRLRLLRGDTVAIELKTPWRDGTSWISMTADAFLERLCSLVRRTGTHQVIYRGVLAAHSERRPRVVRPGARSARVPLRQAHEVRGDHPRREDLARLLRAKDLPTRIDPIRAPRPPPQADFDFGA